MGSLRDAGMVKEAGKGRAAWNFMKGFSGRGINLAFGGMMGATALGHLGQMTEKSPLGIESEVTWRRALDKRGKSLRTPAMQRAHRNVDRAGWIGAGLAGLGSLPSAMKGKNFILPIAAGVLGRLAGRWIAKRKNPLAKEKNSLIDTNMMIYGNLFSPQERNSIMNIRNDPRIMNSPKAQQQISSMIERKAKASPQYKKYTRHNKRYKRAGTVLGVGTLAAMMMFGPKATSVKTVWRSLKTKKKIPNIWARIKRGRGMTESSKKVLGRGMFGTRGGFMSRQAIPGWAALGLTSAGLSIAAPYFGARRAGLSKRQALGASFERSLTLDPALEGLFYGGSLARLGRVRKFV